MSFLKWVQTRMTVGDCIDGQIQVRVLMLTLGEVVIDRRT